MLGLRKEVFEVQGMTCKHCEARVETVIKALGGVAWVKPSHTENRVTVTLKPGSRLERAQMTASIRNAGFEVGETH